MSACAVLPHSLLYIFFKYIYIYTYNILCVVFFARFFSPFCLAQRKKPRTVPLSNPTQRSAAPRHRLLAFLRYSQYALKKRRSSSRTPGWGKAQLRKTKRYILCKKKANDQICTVLHPATRYDTLHGCNTFQYVNTRPRNAHQEKKRVKRKEKNLASRRFSLCFLALVSGHCRWR